MSVWEKGIYFETENVKYFSNSLLDNTDPDKKQLLPTAKRNSKFITGPSFELLDGSESKFVSMFVAALSDSLTKENVCFWLRYQLLIINFDSTTPNLHLHSVDVNSVSTLTQITARCVVIVTS